MKCKQCKDTYAPSRKYSPVFKKTCVNLVCATHKSYLKLISWVALYKSLDDFEASTQCTKSFSKGYFRVEGSCLSGVEKNSSCACTKIN